MVVSNIFNFHPYLGKISNFTNIFQMGWFNHQPVMMRESLSTSICHQHPEREAFQDNPYKLFTVDFWSIRRNSERVSINLHDTRQRTQKKKHQLPVGGSMVMSFLKNVLPRKGHGGFECAACVSHLVSKDPVHPVEEDDILCLKRYFLVNHRQWHVGYGYIKTYVDI